MQFETFPVIIETFPLLVLIPTIAIFCVILVSKLKEVPPDFTKKIWGKLKWGLIILLAGLYFGRFLIGFIAVANYLEIYVDIYYGMVLAFAITMILLMGGFFGIMFAGIYVRSGVSGFLFGFSLFLLLPLLLLYNNWTEFAISFLVEGVLDGPMFIIFILHGICTSSINKKVFGDSTVQEEPARKMTLQIVITYLNGILHKLGIRAIADEDSTAEEALSKLLQVEGRKGQLLTVVARKARAPLDEDIEGYTPTPFEEYIESVYKQSVSSINPMVRKMSLPGTWSLKNTEFATRVKINRLGFFILIPTLVVFVLQSISDLSMAFNQWIVGLFLGLVLVSVPLALLDNTFTGKRFGTDRIVREVLASLDPVHKYIPEEFVEDALFIEPKRSDVEPDVPTEPMRMMSLEDRRNATDSVDAFLRRVEKNKDEVNEESILPIYIAGAGAIPTGVIGMITIIGIGIPIIDSWIIEGLLFFVGLSVMIGGAFWWYILTNQRRFYGARRSWLSVTISYLDIQESGMENMGMIVFPQPPRQFQQFLFAGSNISRRVLETMQSRSSITVNPATIKAGLKSELKINSLVLALFPVLIIVFAWISQTISFLSPFLTVFFVFLVILMILSIIDILRKYRKLKHLDGEPVLEESPEQVVQILRLLRHEYRYPLRLLVFRNHSELTYTGKVYTTTTGIELKEAVFLPS